VDVFGEKNLSPEGSQNTDRTAYVLCYVQNVKILKTCRQKLILRTVYSFVIFFKLVNLRIFCK
jgi:hypothetical protein